MKSEIVIKVKDVRKGFKVFYDKGHTLKERLLFRERRRFEERTVLDGISFEVHRGEAIGLIGQNGCGKSTLLKILTRIMYPNSGQVEIKGRVSSLIELGAGFHPDMSGRENIYINAAIFGLTKKEIDARLNSIITFSELGDYIDNPVRTYSSGMYMRLAFAVAINVDADVLLIDEVLAVGDAAFQAKCFNRLREIKEKGTTIVIVSHALGQIEQICERSIWIKDGKIHMSGNPRDVHPPYMEYMGEKLAAATTLAEPEPTVEEAEAVTEPAEEALPYEENQGAVNGKRWGNGKAKIKEVRLVNSKGQRKNMFTTGEPITIEIAYTVKEKVVNAVFGIGIFRSDGLQCYGTNTRIDRLANFDLEKDGTVTVQIDALNFITGTYTLDVAIECDEGIPVDYYREVCSFEMFSTIGDVGVARLGHAWNIGK